MHWETDGQSYAQIASIRQDGGTQARVALSDATVEEYADLLREGAVLPPLTVFDDGEALWLADGFHRLAALLRAGQELAPVEVREGGRRDAVLFAAGANAHHGLRRSNADKRRAVLLLLEDEEWSRWSNRQIAKVTGTSDPFVLKVRAELKGEGANVSTPAAPATARPTTKEPTQEPAEQPEEEPETERTPWDAPLESVAFADHDDVEDEPFADEPDDELEDEGEVPADFEEVARVLDAAASYLGQARVQWRMCQSALRKKPSLLHPTDASAIEAELGQGGTIQILEARLKGARWGAKCPECSGRGCKSCDQLGWLSAKAFERFKASAVAVARAKQRPQARPQQRFPRKGGRR